MTPITAKIYYNPKCSKCRETLAIIRGKGVEPEIVAYLDAGITRTELTSLIAAGGFSVRDLIRTTESVYLDLCLGNNQKTDDELIDAVVAHPVLLNRPIVLTSTGVRICRPPEMVLEILP